MDRENFKFRLAAPTPLYAPIYLAKYERLTHAFDWVDLDYQPALKSNQLYGDFDDRYGGPGGVVLAAGDPLRLADLAIPNRRIVGGLVKKMCYWVCSERKRTSQKTRPVDLIFAPPPGSTGYIWANVYREKLRQSDGVCPDLYWKSLLADPKEWYRHFQENLSNRRLAYMTSDISVLMYENEYEIHDLDFLSQERDEPLLLTSLVTSDINWGVRRGLIDELLYGVQLGVVRMMQHPRWAARQLSRWAQKDPFIREIFSNENRTRVLVEQLVRRECYNIKSDLRINPDWVTRAVQVHGRGVASTVNNAERLRRMADIVVAACKDINCVNPDVPLPRDGRLDLDTKIRGATVPEISKQDSCRLEWLAAFAAITLAIFTNYKIAPLRSDGWNMYSVGGVIIVLIFSLILVKCLSSTLSAIAQQKSGIDPWRVAGALFAIAGIVWTVSRAFLLSTDGATSVLFNYLGFAALASGYVAPDIMRSLSHRRAKNLAMKAIKTVIEVDYGIYSIRNHKERWARYSKWMVWQAALVVLFGGVNNWVQPKKLERKLLRKLCRKRRVAYCQISDAVI